MNIFINYVLDCNVFVLLNISVTYCLKILLLLTVILMWKYNTVDSFTKTQHVQSQYSSVTSVQVSGIGSIN